MASKQNSAALSGGFRSVAVAAGRASRAAAHVGVPLQRGLGISFGPSRGARTTCSSCGLRGFPDHASRAPLKAAFYEGKTWLGGLEVDAMSMLDDYLGVVVVVIVDLWPRLAAEQPRSGVVA
jgi:hypothetical protein